MDVDAVGVCLLHSFANPAHERRVAELLRLALPDVAVTASVDVLPVVREYERSLATIMNAGVMPAVTTYIQRLQGRLDDTNIKAPLLLHYAEMDENIDKGIPAFEAALKASNKRYTIHIYPGTQHAFNNDTGAARYSKAASDLAWSSTLAFFKEHLGAPKGV